MGCADFFLRKLVYLHLLSSIAVVSVAQGVHLTINLGDSEEYLVNEQTRYRNLSFLQMHPSLLLKLNLSSGTSVGFYYKLNDSTITIPDITVSGFYRILAVSDPVKCNNITLKGHSEVVITKIP